MESADVKTKQDKCTAPTSREQIEQRAYQIYLDRVAQGQPGSEASDWLAAEAELANRSEALPPVGDPRGPARPASTAFPRATSTSARVGRNVPRA